MNLFLVLIPLVLPRPALFCPLATLNPAAEGMKREMLVLVMAAKIADTCEVCIAVVIGADEVVFVKGAEL